MIRRTLAWLLVLLLGTAPPVLAVGLLRHTFVSPQPDGTDPSLVQPSNWNDYHVYQGGSLGNLLLRDTGDAAYGAAWSTGLAFLTSTRQLVLEQGTRTADAPMLDLSVTWNNAGVAFKGARVNVTNSASASGSRLVDLMVSGASKFAVDREGMVWIGAADALWRDSNRNLGIGVQGAGTTLAGTDNLLIGYQAGYVMTFGGGSASTNLLIGWKAGYTNSGSANVAIGYSSAGIGTLAGNNNTCLGYRACEDLTGGSNVIIGSTAAQYLGNGYANTVVGASAGYQLATTDSGVTLLGANANVSASGISNAIAIGRQAIVTAAAQVVIGNTSYPATEAYVGKGVTATTAGTTTIQSSGGSGTNIVASDVRLAAGKSTGAGDPASIYLATSTVLGSGTTLQSLTNRWQVSGPTPTGGAPGDLLAVTDGGVSIGALAGNRPDKVHVKTSFSAAGSAGLTQTLTVRASGGAGDCTVTLKGGIVTATTC